MEGFCTFCDIAGYLVDIRAWGIRHSAWIEVQSLSVAFIHRADDCWSRVFMVTPLAGTLCWTDQSLTPIDLVALRYDCSKSPFRNPWQQLELLSSSRSFCHFLDGYHFKYCGGPGSTCHTGSSPRKRFLTSYKLALLVLGDLCSHGCILCGAFGLCRNSEFFTLTLIGERGYSPRLDNHAGGTRKFSLWSIIAPMLWRLAGLEVLIQMLVIDISKQAPLDRIANDVFGVNVYQGADSTVLTAG